MWNSNGLEISAVPISVQFVPSLFRSVDGWPIHNCSKTVWDKEFQSFSGLQDSCTLSIIGERECALSKGSITADDPNHLESPVFSRLDLLDTIALKCATETPQREMCENVANRLKVQLEQDEDCSKEQLDWELSSWSVLHRGLQCLENQSVIVQ